MGIKHEYTRLNSYAYLIGKFIVGIKLNTVYDELFHSWYALHSMNSTREITSMCIGLPLST